MKTISIVGGGIGGLATAILLAKDGHQVAVYEKNECRGGRAGIFDAAGFRFDMGPSWYLMPDLFEEYFTMIGEDIHEHLDLQQLSPSYKVFWQEKNAVTNVVYTDERLKQLDHYEHTQDGYIYAVRAHIKNTSGQTLLLHDKRWDAFSVPGGKVDTGEDFLTSLSREIAEEIGVAVKSAKKIGMLKSVRSGGLVCHIHYEVIVEGIPQIIETEKFSNIVYGNSMNGTILIDGVDISLMYCKSKKLRRHCFDMFEVMDVDRIQHVTSDTCVYIPDMSTIIDDALYHSLYDYSTDAIHIVHEDDVVSFIDPYIFLDQMGLDLKTGITKVFLSETQNTSFSSLNVYSDIDRMAEQFEQIELGSGDAFRDFLAKSADQYDIGMEFAKKNYDSIFDFFRWDIAWKGLKLNIWTTIDKYVARFFKTPIIRKIMQYTTVFLGTAPRDTPAFYNIMSHVDFAMGVWYPQGGLHEIAEALVKIGKKYGIEYHLNHTLTQVATQDNMIKTLYFENGSEVSSDIYVINADQARFETTMLEPHHQTYPKPYRDKKTFAPSGFIIYAGIDKQLPHLEHHNLYFNEDRDQSFGDIFDRKILPDDPSLYICAPSKTDPTVAPDDKENLFILVPISNGITISPEQKSSYRDQIRKQVEHMAGESIVDHLVYEKIFVVDDFEQRYNARQGTALGLAHKMSQTASFRPNNYSKKLNNLFYVGHNTNPGIGVPMVIVSAMLVTERMKSKHVLH